MGYSGSRALAWVGILDKSDKSAKRPRKCVRVRKVTNLAILEILEDSGLFNVVFWTRITRNDQESVTFTARSPGKTPRKPSLSSGIVTF